MKKLPVLLAIIFISSSIQAQIVISQIYGGGGNSGATYTNDFIELFNKSGSPVNVSGWSVQYATASGTSWTVTALPNISLQPGQYFLIQEAAGANSILNLPTPDLNGMSAATTTAMGTAQLSGIAMNANSGKVILANTATPETTANPSGTNIIDKVAYGKTVASGFEGTGPTGVDLTNTTAAQRKSNGCADTDNNATDFLVATPAPRNSITAINSCALSVKNNEIAGLRVYPNPVTKGTLFLTSNSDNVKTVDVYELLGKQVLSTKTANNAVDLSKLAAGTYILNISEEANTDTVKIIVE